MSHLGLLQATLVATYMAMHLQVPVSSFGIPLESIRICLKHLIVHILWTHVHHQGLAYHLVIQRQGTHMLLRITHHEALKVEVVISE